MLQQQVKTEIGGARGERLVNESQIGVAASGTYTVLDFASAGLFIVADGLHLPGITPQLESIFPSLQ
jgi:hypothetical protein